MYVQVSYCYYIEEHLDYCRYARDPGAIAHNDRARHPALYVQPYDGIEREHQHGSMLESRDQQITACRHEPHA